MDGQLDQISESPKPTYKRGSKTNAWKMCKVCHTHIKASEECWYCLPPPIQGYPEGEE